MVKMRDFYIFPDINFVFAGGGSMFHKHVFSFWTDVALFLYMLLWCDIQIMLNVLIWVTNRDHFVWHMSVRLCLSGKSHFIGSHTLLSKLQ